MECTSAIITITEHAAPPLSINLILISLPPSFQLLSSPALLLCAEHGDCYSLNHVDQHLCDSHHLSVTMQCFILQHLHGSDLMGSHAVAAAIYL